MQRQRPPGRTPCVFVRNRRGECDRSPAEPDSVAGRDWPFPCSSALLDGVRFDPPATGSL